MKEVEVGAYYRHRKGNEYQVIAMAKHSETLEELVVYKDINDPKKIWARPKKMFMEEGRFTPCTK